MNDQPTVGGRDDEMAVLRRLLRDIPTHSAVTVLVGEPGLGKSTIWEALTHEAAAAGVTLLSARPAEAEARAAWSGLTDLLSDLDGRHHESLPAPQRVALDSACLRAAPPAAGVDPRAVWSAMYSVVLGVADAGPVLIAIDDIHWLDPASIRALAYLARRLPARGVVMVATMRTSEIHGPAGELLDISGVTRVDLEPMGPAATAEVIRLNLGTTLAGPALARVHEAAGGNPMCAIELARSNVDRPGRPTAVPASLRVLLSRRLGALSPSARVALAAVAAAVKPSVDQLRAAALADGLAEAEVAGMARFDGGRVHLTHPLIGAAAYEACDGATRRHIHSQLAGVVSSSEERARHAALGAQSPGPEVLAALDVAAATADRRGAPATAAELLTLALELTLDPLAAIERHLAAGTAHFRSGDATAARSHFMVVLDGPDATTGKALAAIRMAEMLWETEEPGVAVGFARRAVELAADDRSLLAEANVVLSRLLQATDLEAAAEAAARAVELLDADGGGADPVLLSHALLSAAAADFELGLGLDRARFERAIELERACPSGRVADRAEAGFASLLKFADDLDGSRRGLMATRAAVIEEGDDSSMPFVLGHLVQVELWAGRWDDAVAVAREHLTHARRTGQDAQRRQAEYNLAIVAAHRGDEAAASEFAASLAAEARASGDLWDEMVAENVLGFVAFCREEHEEAVAHFEIGRRNADAIGLREPLRVRSRTDHVESLIAIGERERAEVLLDEYDRRARAVDRASAIAAVERCRAVLAAVRGQHHEAVRASVRSLAEFDRLGGMFAFERARSLLVAGRVLRRTKQKGAAQQRLLEAGDTFAALGAKRFVDQVQIELGRSGLSPRAPTELTPGERRVAELAARGLTTRQVADMAFVSPKTVEANLTRVYRKLGLSSRAELGAWLASQPASSPR